MDPNKLAEEISAAKSDIEKFIVQRRYAIEVGRGQVTDYDQLVYKMALMLLAAHHAIHDENNHEDYISLCNAAWDKSVETHKTCNMSISATINHEEAKQLAELKQKESNLARCYLDLVDSGIFIWKEKISEQQPKPTLQKTDDDLVPLHPNSSIMVGQCVKCGRRGELNETKTCIFSNTCILQTEPASLLRCRKTGNEYGTDTWMKGYECPCRQCQYWLVASGHKATPNSGPAPAECAGKIWACKIGETGRLPRGADASMRSAIRKAYVEMTGAEPDFIFSGWGAELTEPERAVVEDRPPRVPDATPDGSVEIGELRALVLLINSSEGPTRCPICQIAWNAETTRPHDQTCLLGQAVRNIASGQCAT